MPSFDVVSEINEPEIRNAVDQANREVSTRYDFKGSDARIEQNSCELTLFGDSDFQLGQIKDILIGKLSKRGVDIRCMDWGKAEKISGNKLKQLVTLKKGIDSILSKTIVRLVKDSKMRIQASIQGETVRITGAKEDALQESMQIIRSRIKDFPIQFNNFRD